MKIKHTLILITLMATFSLKAQEPIIVSGYGIPENQFGRILGDFGADGASALFIQERAHIALSNTSVYVINLTEKSAQKIGNPKIGVIYVNNVGIISPPYSEKELITLEVFPIKEDNTGASRLSKHWKIPIYFCKHYEHKDSTQQSWMKMYDDFERDIIHFLEHPPVGDTINQSVIEMIKDRTDSRYTPLLIKNLNNDSEITVEYFGHYHTVPDPSNLDERSETVGFTSYDPVLISDLMREILERTFYGHSLGNWTFDVPAVSASAKEWQIWLDELLKNQ